MLFFKNQISSNLPSEEVSYVSCCLRTLRQVQVHRLCHRMSRRLRGMHPRVSCPGHLCGRRCPGTVEELRRAQQNEIKDTAYPHGKKRAAGKKVVLITMADQRQVFKEAASTENTLDSALRPL